MLGWLTGVPLSLHFGEGVALERETEPLSSAFLGWLMSLRCKKEAKRPFAKEKCIGQNALDHLLKPPLLRVQAPNAPKAWDMPSSWSRGQAGSAAPYLRAPPSRHKNNNLSAIYLNENKRGAQGQSYGTTSKQLEKLIHWNDCQLRNRNWISIFRGSILAPWYKHSPNPPHTPTRTLANPQTPPPTKTTKCARGAVKLPRLLAARSCHEALAKGIVPQHCALG